MPYKSDPWWMSKRLYAALAAIVVIVASAVGLETDQASVVEVLTVLGGALAGFLAFWSKLKERKKLKEDEEDIPC